MRPEERKDFALALTASPPWLCACVFTRLFRPVARRPGTRVVARRDARVRDQQHGRAVRGQHPMRENQTFFGDFLPFSKKLPAPWSGSSGSKTPKPKKLPDMHAPNQTPRAKRNH